MNEDLKAYLDGELAPDRVAVIEVALKDDPGLRAELAQLRALREAIRSGVKPPSVRGYEQTLGALRGGRRPMRWFAQPATAWSALGLAATTVFAVWALRSQPGAVQFSETASEMRPARHSPKIEGAGKAALLDDVESMPRPMVPGAMRKFEFGVQNLNEAVAAVEKLAFDVRAEHMAKESLGDRVKLTVEVPADSTMMFVQGLERLGAPASKAPPADQSQARRENALAEQKETVVEIVLVGPKS